MHMPVVVSGAKRCAFCNEPIRVTQQGVQALRVRDELVCNEFCAQAISEETQIRGYPV